MTTNDKIEAAKQKATAARDAAIAASRVHREAVERAAVLATHADWLVAAAVARQADRELEALLNTNDQEG